MVVRRRKRGRDGKENGQKMMKAVSRQAGLFGMAPRGGNNASLPHFNGGMCPERCSCLLR